MRMKILRVVSVAEYVEVDVVGNDVRWNSLLGSSEEKKNWYCYCGDDAGV